MKTKSEMADDVVQILYQGFAVDTLREMVEVGKELRLSGELSDVPSEESELFQAALEREIERRGRE